MANQKRVILGSGNTYVVEYTQGSQMPTDEEIEIEAHQLGATSGGASFEYTQEKYTAKSDDGKVTKTITTDETVKFKTGIMTIVAEGLKKLVSTGRISNTSNKTTLKIGGISNDDGKLYLVRFVHKDSADGDVRLTIIGKNQSGLTFSFAKDKETVVDAEFTAESMDNEGTLIQLDFYDPIDSETKEETPAGEEE